MTARSKTGGRKAGTPNKASAARVAEIAATGETPLDYMIRIMRDPSVDHRRRDQAAAGAAPYIHPKLASVEREGAGGKSPLQIVISANDARVG